MRNYVKRDAANLVLPSREIANLSRVHGIYSIAYASRAVAAMQGRNGASGDENKYIRIVSNNPR